MEMNRKLLVKVLSLVYTAAFAAAEWSCSRHANDELITGVHQPTSHRVGKKSIEQFQNFRLHIHYDSSINNLPAELRNRLQNTVMPKLKTFFKQTLNVKPTGGPIQLDRRCVKGRFYLPTTPVRRCVINCSAVTKCGPVSSVPEKHLKDCTRCSGKHDNCRTIPGNGEGVKNADFILYVSSSEYDCSSTTIAYANSCELEDNYDRPIAGFTNFCPRGLSTATDERILAVAKHELLHALAFSKHLYPFWREKNGTPRTKRNMYNLPPVINNAYKANETTLKMVVHKDWETRTGPQEHTVYQLVTPRVVAEAQLHFNCSTLKGVEVENQGGAGSMLDHWESRLFQNEAMTGTVKQHPVLSRISLAVLEDSGWYTVDYSMAEQLVWGRNVGCELPTGSCGGYINTRLQQGRPIKPFCSEFISSGTSCSIDRLSRSQCNLQIHQVGSIPANYQYFSNGKYFNSQSVCDSRIGGSQQINDYCPYQMPMMNKNCGNSSNSPGTGFNNRLGETYGTGSRCVEHGSRQWAVTSEVGVSSTSSDSGPTSGCYKYSCSYGDVIIEVLGKSVVCSRGSAGKQVNVSVEYNGFRYEGSILCPSCLDICYDDFANCPEAVSAYKEITDLLPTSLLVPLRYSSSSPSSSPSPTLRPSPFSIMTTTLTNNNLIITSTTTPISLRPSPTFSSSSSFSLELSPIASNKLFTSEPNSGALSSLSHLLHTALTVLLCSVISLILF